MPLTIVTRDYNLDCSGACPQSLHRPLCESDLHTYYSHLLLHISAAINSLDLIWVWDDFGVLQLFPRQLGVSE